MIPMTKSQQRPATTTSKEIRFQYSQAKPEEDKPRGDRTRPKSSVTMRADEYEVAEGSWVSIQGVLCLISFGVLRRLNRLRLFHEEEIVP